MYFATDKNSSVETVLVWDGEDCTFERLSEIVDDVTCLPAKFEDGELKTPVKYTVGKRSLIKGDVLAIKNRAIVDVEIVRVCQFMDTKGTYGLIKDIAIDCKPMDLNEINMPTRLRTGDGVAELGDFVSIKFDGTTKVCSRSDYDTFGQAVGMQL